MYMFADDTTLMYSEYSVGTLDDRCFGSDLVCLQKLFTRNHLDLNVKESEFMRLCQLLTDFKHQNQRLKT